MKTRKTQIPERNLALRRHILNDIDLTEEDIPFAGELIRVKEDEKAWEGAIERRLHDFGLSMLVPERHYKGIQPVCERPASQWQDCLSPHLRNKQKNER